MPRVPTAAKPERYSAERLPMLQAVKRGKAKAAGPFSDLTWVQQKAAEQWYWKFCTRWGNDLPPWRRGILIGVARRLAVNPFTASRGLSLLRAKGGLATSRRYPGHRFGYQALLDRGTPLHTFKRRAA